MKPILFGLTLVLLWQSAEANSQSVAEAARKERERRAALGNAARREQQTITQSSTTNTNNGPGMSEFANRDIGIRLIVPNSWESRVNIAISSVQFRCSEMEDYDGCRLTVASEVAPKNLTGITDAKRKEWAFHFDAKDQVTARDFSLGGLPAFESRGVEQPRGRETRYIHVLARDFGRIYVFTFSAEGKQREDYVRVFEQVFQSFSPVQSSGYAGKNEEPLRLVEEEKEGFKTMFGLFLFSMTCASDTSTKLCTVEEILQNPKVDVQGRQTLTGNPNYSFRVSGTIEKFELEAIPKRPGVGGFLQDEDGVHYNPRGPASKSDPLVHGGDLQIGLIPR